jgi:2-polyprenyl-3-methyl-5-hydroxy-6-metoxy-1,4-benzoquinol methylase
MPLPLASETKQRAAAPENKKLQEKAILKAAMERLWLIDPMQFDSMASCCERERIARTMDLLHSSAKIADSAAVDIGCGNGAIARLLRDEKARVSTIDIAANALKKMEELGDNSGIAMRCDALPDTTLPDGYFDLVICTDVLSYLPESLYRLSLSELARVVKSSGSVICSVQLDASTIDPWRCFAQLLSTEFIIEKHRFSYHRLHQFLDKQVNRPKRLLLLIENKSLREQKLSLKKGVSRKILALSLKAKPVWAVLNWLCKPLSSLLQNSRRLMYILESISKFFWDEAAITHAIAVCKIKPLIADISEPAPMRLEGKKRVWE